MGRRITHIDARSQNGKRSSSRLQRSLMAPTVHSFCHPAYHLNPLLRQTEPEHPRHIPPIDGTISRSDDCQRNLRLVRQASFDIQTFRRLVYMPQPLGISVIEIGKNTDSLLSHFLPALFPAPVSISLKEYVLLFLRQKGTSFQ